jgi:hypothetical protein
MRPLLATLVTLFSVLAAGLAHAATPVVAGSEDRCWADWSAAAPIVHRESLRPAKDVRELVQQGLVKKANQGQLLNITLCEERGQFVYRLLILRTAGTVETVTVDARSPSSR